MQCGTYNYITTNPTQCTQKAQVTYGKTCPRGHSDTGYACMEHYQWAVAGRVDCVPCFYEGRNSRRIVSEPVAIKENA